MLPGQGGGREKDDKKEDNTSVNDEKGDKGSKDKEDRKGGKDSSDHIIAISF